MINKSTNHVSHAKTAIKSKTKLSQVSWEVLRADLMIRAINSSFDITDHCVDPGEDLVIWIVINA